jgi:hypothetical protein
VNTKLNHANEFDEKYAALQNKINGIISDMHLN